MIMKRTFILLILICLAFIFFPAQKVQAMDPVMISLLAPIAIKAAEVASPYVLKGLASGAKQMVVIGKDLLGVMRLPLGFFQVVFLAPFGHFKKGVKNLVLGAIAPFKLAFHAALLPVALVGFPSG
jgi:hypothetical protein